MTFKFNAEGTRDEVVSKMENLSNADLGYDELGVEIRDTLVDVIGNGTDLEPPSDQRYQVAVSGSSGRGQIVSLNAQVKVVPLQASEPVGLETTEVPVAQEATAS